MTTASVGLTVDQLPGKTFDEHGEPESKKRSWRRKFGAAMAALVLLAL